MPSVFAWIASLPDPRVLADLGAAVQYLATRSEVRRERVGITGYCMGGQYALMAACSVPASPPAFRGTACCATRAQRAEADQPARARAAPRVSLPRLFGAEDAIIPNADVDELRTILTREKVVRHQELPGAGHAFFNDTRPDAYRPDAAADAWPRAVEFLRTHLAPA
jgi:carboxymethylenebutenolidase